MLLWATLKQLAQYTMAYCLFQLVTVLMKDHIKGNKQ